MASVRERTTKGGERTWQVLYRHGGKQPSKTFATPKAAEQFAALLNALGVEDGLKALAERTESGMTVAELAEQYLAWKTTGPKKVTERTITDYRRDVANYIVPWLGHRAAGMVDEGDVQSWVDHMTDTLSPKSVADRHMLLHSMYEFGRAKSRRLVDHNPCKETSLPTRKKHGLVKAISIPEYRALLDAAARRNPDAHDLILFLGATGWRFSEATALAVGSVEDGDRGVWVQVDRVFRLDASGRQYIAEEEAKSQAGLRRMRPTGDAWSMLRRRVVGKAVGDFVFTNSRGRPWNQNTWLRDTWPTICEDAGVVGRTPHMLRHAHVAVMVAAGAQPSEIKNRLGHEDIKTTLNTYGSGIGDVSDEALRNAEAIMSGRGAAGAIVAGELVRPTLEIPAT